MKRCVFVDLLGGLLAIDDGDVPRDVDAIRLQEGCVTALLRLSGAGFRLVLLSDDRSHGVGPVSAFVVRLLASQQVRFDAVRHCEHDATTACDCAMPGIGLVAADIADPGLSRSESIVVGARPATLGLARAMGLRGFELGQGQSWSDIAHTVLDRPRRATVRRQTRETDIAVSVDLDRPAEPQVTTGIAFFDHMLEQLGKHGGFALELTCAGDLEVDEHHTVEDVALAIGQALKEALGDKRGIGRYGFVLPMDEAQASVAIDLSGRAFAVFEGSFPRPAVGGLPTELVSHFFRSIGDALGAAIQISVRGDNAHHMVEACFKSVGRALRQALRREGNDLPSTKGTLSS